LLEKHPVRIRSCGRPSGKGLQPPATTTNLLRGEKMGRKIKKLTAIKSPVVGAAKWRELHPGAGTGQKAQEVPLHPANIRQLKQRGRPNSQKNRTDRLSNQNDQISRSSSLNDKTDGTIHPDNQTVQLDPQEIRTIKRHAWRKNYEK
jgi:hypothetical protein